MRLLRSALLSVLLCLAACASPPVEEPEEAASMLASTDFVAVGPDVPLAYASGAQSTPFNISILLFDNGTAAQTVSRIYEPIRDAEAAYFPVVLKRTLDESGYWGAVSVVPTEDAASEIFVSGTIVESTALELILDIEVKDSRGVVWFDRRYRSLAEIEGYEQDVTLSQDPFQTLFNQIANDLSDYREQLTLREENALLDTAMLRYAILLSPEAFSRYLIESEAGLVELAGLPARNDPLYRRVREIRDREFAVQDIVDQHFSNFFTDMRQVYPYWRQSSYELLAYNDQLENRTDSRRKNSWQEVERVYRLYKERKLNEDELRELATSFEREIEPTVAELEGRVIELQGSLFDQYKTWRRILREIYRETVGGAS